MCDMNASHTSRSLLFRVTSWPSITRSTNAVNIVASATSLGDGGFGLSQPFEAESEISPNDDKACSISWTNVPALTAGEEDDFCTSVFKSRTWHSPIWPNPWVKQQEKSSGSGMNQMD